MFNSPFSDNENNIPSESDIIFVSDYFVDDILGGAELTSEALIESSPFNVYKLQSKDVTPELLKSGLNKHWIFGNYAHMDLNLIPSIVANLSYSIIEYDYKYCTYRSPQKHINVENTDCDCHDSMHGKMISAFMYGAKSLWWMSEAQQNVYLEHFPFLSEKDGTVLSSVFSEKFFTAIHYLNESNKDVERKGWIVLGSTSWVKGTDDAIQHCINNDLDYELIQNLEYGDVLEKLSKAKGLVFLPAGADTCPRLVIEAKLLGCKLVLNENVQHKDELWFNTSDILDTQSYLYGARERFWNGIKYAMNYNPTLSGYTTTLDCNKGGYPWVQSIKSMLGFCDEVVVVDGGSTDGTYEQLLAMAAEEPRLKISLIKRDWDHPRFAVFDGAQKASARRLCTMQYCWQQDADELVHENDYEKIRRLLTVFPQEVDLVSLPVVEFWGSQGKTRMDVTPWKWRVSRNKPEITHGIPSHFQTHDEDGYLHALPGTDGCDYIHKDTNELIPHASFYIEDAHNLRMMALNNNADAHEKYKEWFAKNIEMLPTAYHYSWYDLERKIKTYRDYWSQHWQSLYNIPQEDTPENNMFFDKSWSKVTNKDIKRLAKQLGDKMGGWVFHEKVDFSKPTPDLGIDVSQPALMLEDEVNE